MPQFTHYILINIRFPHEYIISTAPFTSQLFILLCYVPPQCVCIYCQELYIIKAAKLAQIADVLFSISTSIETNIHLSTFTFVLLTHLFFKLHNLIFQYILSTNYFTNYFLVDDIFMCHLSFVENFDIILSLKLSFFKSSMCIFLSFFKGSCLIWIYSLKFWGHNLWFQILRSHFATSQPCIGFLNHYTNFYYINSKVVLL